ncbi:hypothetical protein [Streptomyces cylindrosporus]|uniref:Peptidase C39-like domain-containing protein n=1 Tax=Streptomyces cylindrosporus TaxID=2927583 RepID=A0ABS9YJV3_9ACTN|nr:hypothetical protein [Streptomyces cylindrosporus]MCI3277538.1 hypothetical protein [Streptomyces cylindrosporus]
MPRPVITFRGGRRPHDPDRPHLKVSRLLTTDLPAPPAAADWLSPVPADAWGMLGNDEVGDCTIAGIAHKRIGDAYANQGLRLDISTADCLKYYGHFGYRPGDPSTDNGAVCQDVLAYWHTHGFRGEKNLAYARINVDDHNEVKQAIHLFGQIYCGVTITQAAEDQFNGEEVWSLKRSPVLGGHCITIGAYDRRGLDAVTWGTVHRMTWRWWDVYGDEAWAVFNPSDFVDPKTGRDRAGLDLATMRADYTALTGRSLAAGA